MRRAAAFVLALSTLWGGCSFTTATGFQECNNDTECGAAQVCLKRYCIPLPPGCRRDFGDFTSADHAVLAAALPLTDSLDGGVADDSETAGLDAFRLAVGEANEKQGLNGRRFALYVCNTTGSEDLVRSQSAWLARELGAPAIFTSGSSQTIAAAVATEDAGAPALMSATATSPDLIGVFQGQHQRVWRVAPPDTLQARVISDLFAADGGVAPGANVAVLYEKKAYGEGLSGALRDRLAPRLQVTIVPFDRGGDINVPVDRVNTLAPAVTIVVAFPPDIRRIVERARLAAPNLSAVKNHRWFFTDSAKDPAILQGTLDVLAGTMGTAPAQNAGPTFGGFQPNFVQKFGFDPQTFSYTSHSYDAMYLVLLASAYADGHGGLSGARLTEGLKLLSVQGAPEVKLLPENYILGTTAMRGASPALNVVGASGDLDFDVDAGAPSSKYEIWQVLPDAGFATLKLVAPSGT
ncbi:MAG: ABC transporter substrate-binding protein [Myxococcaceae bacterium]|nr:ABC transporter substrate-binding protein [Myxococcaceae bacterium]